MEWFRKHTDTVIILTGIISSVLWMNVKFNDIDKNFSKMEKEIAIVKTVLIMQKIMPAELASMDLKKKDS